MSNLVLEAMEKVKSEKSFYKSKSTRLGKQLEKQKEQLDDLKIALHDLIGNVPAKVIANKYNLPADRAGYIHKLYIKMKDENFK